MRKAFAAGIAVLIASSTCSLAQSPQWSGFYIGGNVGYGWGKAASDTTASGAASLGPGVVVSPPATQFGDEFHSSLSGFNGGGQVGYNFQSQRWVIGFEADLQGGKQSSSGSSSIGFIGNQCTGRQDPPPICVFVLPISFSGHAAYETNIDWFGTARGRLGWLLTDRLLIYGTGGLSFGQVSTAVTLALNGVSALNLYGPGVTTAGTSKTNLGFALGGGFEGRLANSSSWTWKVEYLFIDVGSVNVANAISVPSQFAPWFFYHLRDRPPPTCGSRITSCGWV